MKTFTRIILLIAITTLITLNVLASGLNFEPESYINDIPFDLDTIETMARFEEAVSVEFSFPEEDYISDMTFTESDLDNIGNYHRALSLNFDFDEEEYIDDIPMLSSDSPCLFAAR